MNEKIPIFPLDLVLFPNQRVPLRIFEPRYRQMLDACMSTDRKFGICNVKHAIQKSGWDAPSEIWTMANIMKCEDLDLTGTNYYVEVMGKERFQIEKLIPPALEKPVEYNPPNSPSMKSMLHQVSGEPLYFQGEITFLPEIRDTIEGAEWTDIIRKLKSRLRTAANKMGIEFRDFLGFIENSGLDVNEGDAQGLYNIASMCSLEINIQQSILEAENVTEASEILSANL